jgi:hypothetical protein
MNRYNPNNYRLVTLTLADLRRLSTSKTPKTIGPVKVTAELAAFIIERNDENRKVVKSTTDTYRDTILKGAFKYNGESSCVFTIDGKNRNAGHRCIALLEAAKVDPNAFIILNFTFGVAPDAVDTMDSGRVRSIADRLVMRDGMSPFEASVIAARARILWIQLRQGHRQRAPIEDIDCVLADFKEGLKVARGLTGHRARSEYASAFAMAATAYPKKVEELIVAIENGTAGTLPAGERLVRFIQDGSDNSDVTFRKVLNGIEAFVLNEDRLRLHDSKKTVRFFAEKIAEKKDLAGLGPLKMYLDQPEG